MNKDTFYFSHDYNARNDSKIKKLLSKHGYIGYGIYWAIIEDLYNNANALHLDYQSIAFDLRMDEKVIQSIIKDFDLFVFENDIFGSLSVQKRLEERNSKSQKARNSALKRWNNANALQTQSDSNAIKESKVKEKKGKESKVNETKEYVAKKPLVQPEYVLCIDFWLKEFHPGWTFSAQKGKALKSIIKKIHFSLKDRNLEYTPEEILRSFKLICNKLPEFFKNKDLEIIDSKFNEIISEIKTPTKNGKHQQTPEQLAREAIAISDRDRAKRNSAKSE